MGEVTYLVRNWNQGNKQALDQLFEILYEELKPMARARLAGEKHRSSYPTCALISDLYVRMQKSDVDVSTRYNFFGVVAMTMRRILVERARYYHAQKRDVSKQDGEVTFDLGQVEGNDKCLIDQLILEQLLKRFAPTFPERARVLELKLYLDLPFSEIAEIMGKDTRTVNRYWQFAVSWISREARRKAV